MSKPGKYPATPHDEAMRLGDEALQRDSKGIFRFNPGLEQKTVPDYNPYTIRRCRDCDIAKGKVKLNRFTPESELCQACAIFQNCAGDREKSATAVERKHYLREMEHLLSTRCSKELSGHATIRVGFSSLGNKHLYSDTFGRSSVLTKEDLKTLDVLLAQAIYDGESGLTHSRNDDIDRFYYFKTSLRGQDIRLNVAQQIRRLSDGRIRVRHVLYSINDI